MIWSMISARGRYASLSQSVVQQALPAQLHDLNIQFFTCRRTRQRLLTAQQ